MYEFLFNFNRHDRSIWNHFARNKLLPVCTNITFVQRQNVKWTKVHYFEPLFLRAPRAIMFKSQIRGLAPQRGQNEKWAKIHIFKPNISPRFQRGITRPPKGSKFWGWGPLTPKNFGVPKCDFLIVHCKKNENWKKIFGGGVGVPTPPSPSPQNWNRPLVTVLTLCENFRLLWPS